MTLREQWLMTGPCPTTTTPDPALNIPSPSSEYIQWLEQYIARLEVAITAVAQGHNIKELNDLSKAILQIRTAMYRQQTHL